MDIKLFKALINELISEAGFKKKSNNWYWANDDVIFVVNLQKSIYGMQFYLNFGVALRDLEIKEYPKENKSHIRFRLSSIVPVKKKKEVDAVFDLENNLFSDEKRREIISFYIRDVALPFLFSLSSKEGIAEAISSGKLSKAMVHKKVKELVGANLLSE